MLRDWSQQPRDVPVDETKGTVWAPLRVAPATAAVIPISIQDVVSADRSNLLAGASIDAVLEGDYKVQALIVDVGPDVSADVYLDDVKRWSVRDGKGLGGQFTLGNLGGQSLFRLRKIRVVATNNHATDSRDVRAWMTTMP